jgi:hypothetical protein
MGYKQIDTNLSFADIALRNSLERNRAIERMQQIEALRHPAPCVILSTSPRYSSFLLSQT